LSKPQWRKFEAMKKLRLLFTACLLNCGHFLFAQDIIVSTSGDTINCKIIEQQEFQDIEGGYLIFQREGTKSEAKVPLSMVRNYRKNGNWRVLSQIQYDDLVSDYDFRRSDKYDSYLSKRGDLYSVGDTIKIDKPSGNNGFFVYITSFDIMGQNFAVGSNRTNTFTVIKNIRVGGSSRTGWKVSFQTQGGSLIDNYFLFIEDAIESGEIKSKTISSDEALEQLKRAKEKLDLELMSQSEYNAIKERLRVFID
jgi:hypothetical protein